MGVRAHRINEIVYAESTLFKVGSNLADAILNHPKTDNENGSIIELQFQYLKEILENRTEYSLDEDEIKSLTV